MTRSGFGTLAKRCCIGCKGVQYALSRASSALNGRAALLPCSRSRTSVASVAALAWPR